MVNTKFKSKAYLGKLNQKQPKVKTDCHMQTEKIDQNPADKNNINYLTPLKC